MAAGNDRGVVSIRKKPMYKDIVRFWQCVFPEKLSGDALGNIRKILNDDEYRVFASMYPIDQLHGYEVYRVMHQYAADTDTSITPIVEKAILLHDVGKNALKITVYDRVIVGLFNKLPSGLRITCLSFFLLRPFAASYNKNAQHPEAGARILEENGIDPQIVRLVRYHHDREACYGELGTEGQLIYAIDNYF